jgi:hypothetical protein
MLESLKATLKPGMFLLNEGSMERNPSLTNRARERAMDKYRKRFQSVQESLPAKGPFSPKHRVPRLSDPDIVELFEKYPNLARQEKRKELKGKEVRKIIKKAEEYLEFTTAEYDINLHELKTILDKERQDEHRLATDLLDQAADIEDKNLKSHINYTLGTMRGEKEMEKEVLIEYFHIMVDPETSLLKSRILKNATMRKKEQREWKKKLESIMDKANKMSNKQK